MTKKSELTGLTIGLGLLLSVVMGAANVYLGLKVGMTVSASIPAAVVAMAILNGMLKRRSPLEANIVQTAASAGESLAAGIIFTMPALIITGIWAKFDYWTTSLIALSGGMLGILLMIPMRRIFVVDSPELPYPEGIACAEVLRTGEQEADDPQSTDGAKLIVAGLGIGAIFKFLQSFLHLFHGSVEWARFAGNRVFFFGGDIAPALLGVGVIVGLPVASQVFLGGSIGWLIAIPLMYVEPTGDPIEAASGLWSTRVRYIGVGAMVVGGILSIWRVRRGLVAAVDDLLFRSRSTDQDGPVPETERNLGMGTVTILSILTIALIAGIYYHLLQSTPITIATTVIMLVMAFFFTAVASYIVGLVGNSNSPVSGMTITAVLGTGGLMLLFQKMGWLELAGDSGMIAVLGVAGIVCCVACTAGDVCNDLKTGHLIGASPRNQQIMQVGGVAVAAFVMAPVLTMLHEGAKITSPDGIGIGGEELPAPQAGLFAALAEGFFGDGNLPWDMIGWGVGIGITIAVIDGILGAQKSKFRLHIMPVAVGIYLPFGISVPMLLGAFLSDVVLRRNSSKEKGGGDPAVLAASGLIAGESLVGVLLGGAAFSGIIAPSLAEGLRLETYQIEILSIVAILAVAAWLVIVSRQRKGN